MTRALIAKIHIAKKQLELDDDLYRAVLADVANGKTSCANMNASELQAVLDHFKAKGFKPKKSKNARRISPPSGSAKLPEIDKIRAIWITMGQHGIIKDPSETALNAYVKRMTAKQNDGKGIESVAWLNYATCNTVLEALKQWHRRTMADRLTKIGVTIINQKAVSKPVHQASYDWVVYTYKFWQKRGKL
jgi:phage gp16-like protein